MPQSFGPRPPESASVPSGPRTPAQVVWLKRDLRVDDHRPLVLAARRGPVVVLYVHEPEVLAQPTTDASHVVFVNQCLAELREELRARGADLVVRHGEITDVLDRLLAEVPFDGLWSHEETGTGVTFARDRGVAAWVRERGIEWTEIPQHGVVRRLSDRDGWARRWALRMREPLVEAPESLVTVPGLDPGPILSPRGLGVGDSRRVDVQRGGERKGRATLDGFLAGRGVGYREGMSSPVSAWEACSRLSPHLTYGTVSLRRVHQETEARRREIRELRRTGHDVDDRWLGSLSSFSHRLRWHCHFIQKLEDEPRLEFENLSRAHDGLRDPEPDPERLAAWSEGRTGYPMVDACMRALRATGWINFRMRAMLVSFASYHLWLHWRATSLVLARRFLDFEPGIHWSQFQMQSGTTGINAVRIYSPAKQVRDHDPGGRFVRRWVPELEGVPDSHVAEPHLMTVDEQLAAGCRIGRDYPAPIVDHRTAYRTARARVFAVRRTDAAREEARRVVRDHGSRRRRPRRPGSARR